MVAAYTDIEKADINNSLRKLGVEPEAQQTTLPLQARQDLQDLITSRAQEDYPAILFYPASNDTFTDSVTTNNIHHCDLLYQLYIKENYLFRNRVYRSSVLDMYSALNEYNTFIEEDSNSNLPNKKQTANPSKTQVVMGIEDFFKNNTASMTTKDYRIREVYERYLRYCMFGAKRLLILKSSRHPTYYEDTWSSEFSTLLLKKAKIIQVTAP